MPKSSRKPIRNRKRSGPPVKPESERAKSVNASLTAAAYTMCERVGDGSASRGLRLLAVAALESGKYHAPKPHES